MSRWDDAPDHEFDDEAPQDRDVARFGDDDDATETWFCPECGASVYEEASRCPRCGEWITPTPRAPRTLGGVGPTGGPRQLLLILLVALLIAGLLLITLF